MHNSVLDISHTFLERPLKEVCHLDKGENYIVVLKECKNEIIRFSDFLKELPGYNGTVAQTLGHNNSGNISRS